MGVLPGAPMDPDGVHVCAVVQTRNDAASLPRLAKSLVGVIDEWLVVDFGSADDTIAVAEKVLAGWPGRVMSRPWIDPIYNGNETLRLAGKLPQPSHLLVLEPDMVVEATDTFRRDLAHASAQRLSVVVRRPAFDLREPLVLRSGPAWCYEGRGYRRLTSEAPVAAADFDGLRVLHYLDRVERKVVLDEEVSAIIAALGDSGDGGDDPLIAFHLAMNYRELGRDDKALEAFEQCRAISASPEMTFYCTYQIAELHYRLQQYADASWAYQEAMQVDPHRLEPYHRLGRLLNEQARWEASRVWLEHAATLPPPMHGLNMESWVSAWGISFELAIARWWTGDRPGADRLFAAVLQRDDVPQRFKDACERNLALAKPSS